MHPGEAVESILENQVLSLARRISGLTIQEIAERIGRDPATVGGWFAAGSDRWPPASLLPKLSQILGDPILIEWLYAQYRLFVESEPEQLSATNGSRIQPLLIRALGQVTTALNLARDLGPNLTKPQSRQISESILLAVATLCDAAREARGRKPAPARLLRFGSIKRPLPQESLWARIRRSLRSLFVVAELQSRLAAGKREHVRMRRLIGTLGYMVRTENGRNVVNRTTRKRVLADCDRVVREARA